MSFGRSLGALSGILLVAGCGGAAVDRNMALGGNQGDGGKIDSVGPEPGPTRANGPFGIAAGMSLAELDKSAQRDPETGLAVLGSAPVPSSQFPTVAVVAFPETGVCEVRGMSREFESDSYITAATGFADEVAGALDSRYGKGKLDEGCSGYACDNQFKLQEIESGARWYGYRWEAVADRPFDNHVTSISLWVNHTQFNNSQVRLDYVFDNDAACDAASKKAKAANL